MIRTTCKYNRLLSVVPRVFKGIFALLSHIRLESVLLDSGSLNGLLYIRLIYMESLEFSRERAEESLVIVIRKERMIKPNHILAKDIVHIIRDSLRICSNYRAVIVIRCGRIFVTFIVKAWIEYPLNSLVNEPFDVSVHHLGRITCRIGTYCLHSALVEALA